MRKNPFDKTLSPETREKVAKRKSFLLAQADVADVVHTCELQRKRHKRAWEEHKRQHHDRRLEQAVEREDADATYLTVAERERRKVEDDQHFDHVKHEDQLLELKDHEEYLRGRRALRRRKRVRTAETTVKVEVEPTYTGPTGLQVWAGIVGIFLLVGFLSALKEGAGAIILLPVLFVLWSVIVRLPGWANIGGNITGGGVRTGRGGGNAV